MEVNQFSEILIGELTVEQYIVMLGFIFGLIIISCFLFSIISHILNSVLDLIQYAIRKDKYNSRNFAVLRAYRHIASLRKQVKNAPSEKSYYLFYNRLIGAVQFAREMGYIGERNILRLIDIPFNYGDKDIEADERNEDT